MRNWYVVQTRSSAEIAAAHNLQARGFEAWVPWAERNHKMFALFPGYLFIHLDVTEGDWSKIRSTPKVIRLVPGADGVPARLPDTAYNAIRSLVADDQVIHLSSLFKKGDPVQLREGVFKLQRAIVLGTNKERVQILLEIIGKQHVFEVEPEDLYRLA